MLHLGHAYSALVNQRCCEKYQGTMLLRLEDIDQARCTEALETQMLEDLRWMEFQWSGTSRRQSQHFSDYQQALETLKSMGVVYPAFMTRGEIRTAIAQKRAMQEDWPTDPDGTPHYPGAEATWSKQQQEVRRRQVPRHAWRLNMAAALAMLDAPLTWQEFDCANGEIRETVEAHPRQWGDVVLARPDTPTSYHLSVVVDDALQGITHVVRGRDLYHATAVHRLLQALLGLPEPIYHHHQLVLDEDGRKLSKSDGDQSLRHLQETGVEPAQLEQLFTSGLSKGGAE